ASVSGRGWVGVGLGVAGMAILAWTAVARMPSPRTAGGGRVSFATYQAGWREAHLLEEGAQPGGRVAAAYLRVPYVVGAPLARAGVDPDLVTLLALWVALVAGWVAALGPGWAAAAGGLPLSAGGAGAGGGGGRAHPAGRVGRLGRRGGGGAPGPDQRLRVRVGLDRRPAGRPGRHRRA